MTDWSCRKIQEEGLRTYLFTYSTYYASLSLSHLTTTFQLSQSTITSLVSRMIYSDELAASLDQIEGVVVFHRVEQTEVQRLAQQLAERAVYMLEQNEKTLDVKLGSNQDRGLAGTGATTDAGRGGTERRGGTRGTSAACRSSQHLTTARFQEHSEDAEEGDEDSRVAWAGRWAEECRHKERVLCHIHHSPACIIPCPMLALSRPLTSSFKAVAWWR